MGVQRLGVDSLAFFHAVQGVGGESLLENQMIFGYAFSVKCFIEWPIANHFLSPSPYYHTQPLDYTQQIEYN